MDGARRAGARGAGLSPRYPARVLDRRALVLNRSWMPISTTSVRRAILLLARGAAGAVHPVTYEVAGWDDWLERGPQDGDGLPCVGFRLPLPDVVVLLRYNGVPDRPVAFTRRNVYRRDGFRCQYCQSRPGPDQLTIDHVLPRSRGGATTWENCVTACFRCNARKANRNAMDCGLVLHSVPVAPRWPGGLDPASLEQRPSWKPFFARAGRISAAESA